MKTATTFRNGRGKVFLSTLGLTCLAVLAGCAEPELSDSAQPAVLFMFRPEGGPWIDVGQELTINTTVCHVAPFAPEARMEFEIRPERGLVLHEDPWWNFTSRPHDVFQRDFHVSGAAKGTWTLLFVSGAHRAYVDIHVGMARNETADDEPGPDVCDEESLRRIYDDWERRPRDGNATV